MQEGEEHLPAPHPRELGRHRLLHLEHELRVAPEIIGRFDDGRARRGIASVGDRRSGASVLLDEHRVAVAHELRSARRRDRDAELAVLQLSRNPDPHYAPIEIPDPTFGPGLNRAGTVTQPLTIDIASYFWARAQSTS